MFHLVSTGYNCAEWLADCAASVMSQSMTDWHWHVALDGGGNRDREVHILKGVVGADPRVHLLIPSERRYATWNIRHALILAKPADDDVIVLGPDLDDTLLPNALAVVDAEYRADPNLLCTYGSHICASGRKGRFQGPYKAKENIRVTRWKASHLRTFKAVLWKRIKDSDLRGPDGQWYRVAWDMAIGMPVLEMAGHGRRKFIAELLYRYNDMSAFNDHKVHHDEQKAMERWIRRQRPYRRWQG